MLVCLTLASEPGSLIILAKIMPLRSLADLHTALSARRGTQLKLSNIYGQITVEYCGFTTRCFERAAVMSKYLSFQGSCNISQIHFDDMSLVNTKNY